MLSKNHPIKNYEDFKEMFVREDGRRKNAVLLAWYKSRPMMTWIRENVDRSKDYIGTMRQYARGFKIHDMSELKDYIMWLIRSHVDYNKSESMHDSIWIPNYGWFGSDLYRTDRNGLCFDRDYRSYRYIRKDNSRPFKMKMGRMFNHIIDCTTMAEILPNAVRLWICEEVQRDWEAHTRREMPSNEFELHVDNNFAKIYDGDWLVGDFGSCMTDKDQYPFYIDAVKAKAAYLTDENEHIVARCVIFTEVEDINTGEVVRLAERQYSSEGKEVLKQDLINALIKDGHIDGYKRIGAGCGESNAFVDVNGESWSDRHFRIKCDLDYGDTLSYQDSFKWYDIDQNYAYNRFEDCNDDIELATTAETLQGRNWDEWHERWTNNDLVTVHYNGREYTCDNDDTEDFVWIDNSDDYGYFHRDDVSYCEECCEDFVSDSGYYSELTQDSYCCESCRDDAERQYKEDNWHYSEYDDDWFEDEDDVTTLKRGSGDEITICTDSAERLVCNGEAICINGKFYDTEWAECILDEA